MIANFYYLFQYLEKENINIDKAEFEFQIQSHPDYSSLVSISDTLSFFNVENAAMRIEFTDLDLLPDRFVALLNEEDNIPKLYFIERKANSFTVIHDKKAAVLSESELSLRWKDVVLLVEKLESVDESMNSKNDWSWIFKITAILLLILVIAAIDTSLSSKLFIFFPLIGILFTVAALKDLFGAKSELLNNFCNMTASTSCVTVVNSNKWKVFELLNFSDLSMVFFGSQFVGLLVFLLSGNIQSFFFLQEILLLMAIPVILASLYYQKFVEKKWCPICLIISSAIVLELVYLFVLQGFNVGFTLPSLLLFGLISISVLLVWKIVKEHLIQLKELKEFQIKGTRFMRNFPIFKNNLLATERIENGRITSGTLLLGNPNAPLKIVLVTNPFCGFCKEAHAIMEYILEKHHDAVCFDIRFNYNSELDNENSKKLHQQLLAIYLEHGEEMFKRTLQNWFEHKNYEEVHSIPVKFSNVMKINQILEEQSNWNKKYNLIYTPALVLNGYIYPKKNYERKDLVYFISDILEDEDLQLT